MSGHVLLLTGNAPYLGGVTTWAPLRNAAPEVEFRDLDLMEFAAQPDFLTAIKRAIAAAASGARAVVAHGTVAAAVLEALAEANAAVPVLLLSPLAVTNDSSVLRLLRAALRSPMGRVLAAVAGAKRKKMLRDEQYLRKQMALLVRSDAITDELIADARERTADPRMDAIVDHTAQTLCAVLTPSAAFKYFNGTALFGTGPMDVKMRQRISGVLVTSARSAPMVEAPEEVAEHLRALI